VYLVAILLLGGILRPRPVAAPPRAEKDSIVDRPEKVLPRGELSARLICVGLLVAALAVAVT